MANEKKNRKIKKVPKKKNKGFGFFNKSNPIASQEDMGAIKDLITVKKEELEAPKEDYRISIIPKREKAQGLQGLKEERQEEAKKKRQERIERERRESLVDEENYEINYTIVRKEVKDLAPLHAVGILDKIRIAFRYMDIKKGKKAQREAEALRKQQQKIIEVESAIKKYITDAVQPLLDRKMKSVTFQISIPEKNRDLIDSTLKNRFFDMFTIKEISINPNCLKYDKNIPRMFKFELKEGVKYE